MPTTIRAGGVSSSASTINLRCPLCHKLSVFSPIGLNDAIFFRQRGQNQQPVMYGIRVCSNPECGEPIFAQMEQGKPFITYPAERLDFEPIDIPARIAASIEEAITNHANQCFRSAAIMIRRTLEEICADKHAGGSDLKLRLRSLEKLIIVPKELMDAADELRLLGNDAAHLDARVYDGNCSPRYGHRLG